MPRMIFVNLPVADLPRTKAFYEAIAAVNEPRFTNLIGLASFFVTAPALLGEQWASGTLAI